MGLNYEDLPKKLKDQVDAKLGPDSPGAVMQPKKRKPVDSAPCVYDCGVCETEWPTYLAAEKHLDLEHEGSGRLRMRLPEPAAPG